MEEELWDLDYSSFTEEVFMDACDDYDSTFEKENIQEAVESTVIALMVNT